MTPQARTFLISTLALTLLLGPLVPSFAQEKTSNSQQKSLEIQKITPKQARRTLRIHLQGRSSLPTGARLSLCLMRETKTLLQKTVLVESGGAFQGLFQVRGLLLAGSYTVEAQLAKDQEASLQATLKSHMSITAKKPLQLGSEAEAKAALERVEDWLTRAHASISGMALELEQRAAWSFQAMKNLGAQNPKVEIKHRLIIPIRNRFKAFLENNLSARIQTAAMDLQVYQRRLVYKPHPKLGEQLKATLEALKKQGQLQLAALKTLSQDKAASLPSRQPWLELDQAFIAALKLDAKLSERWQLGVEAQPEVGAVKDSRYLSQTGGFSLAVPQGWSIEASRAYWGRRLSLQPPSKRKGSDQVVALIRILPQPQGTLLSRTGIDGWESYPGYQRVELKDPKGDDQAVRHVFEYNAGQSKRWLARVFEYRMRRPDGRLLVFWAAVPKDQYEDWQTSWETIAQSLKCK